MTFQQSIRITTPGRGMTNITTQIADAVQHAKITTGLCNVFIHHTSASLIICENSDPVVQQDLERFMSQLIPDGHELFQHIEEGPDDMPSHVRTILTQSSITIPITENHLALGTWQGIYLWEHRLLHHERTVTVTIS